MLQSVWREEQKLKPAVWWGKLRGNRLVMPDAKLSLSNYLTENIREVVKSELSSNAKRPKSMRGWYAPPRIYNNLLSSQPLCFNLFAELQRDLFLATEVFRDMTDGRVVRVNEIDFEFSPGRENQKYTGDKSAFDVYLEYLTRDGEEGFVGIEVKYHENPLDRNYVKDEKRYYQIHGDRYNQIATNMGCFLEEQLDDAVRGSPIQQFWRDHLLVGCT